MSLSMSLSRFEDAVMRWLDLGGGKTWMLFRERVLPIRDAFECLSQASDSCRSPELRARRPGIIERRNHTSARKNIRHIVLYKSLMLGCFSYACP